MIEPSRVELDALKKMSSLYDCIIGDIAALPYFKQIKSFNDSVDRLEYSRLLSSKNIVRE